jgi:hypothetical protein
VRGAHRGPTSGPKSSEAAMRVRMSKSIFAGLAALIVLIAVSVSTPAAAFRMGGGGFHGGGFGGGFHGGGFGGGLHGGGFGGWRGGVPGGGGGVGATVAGAVAAGAMPDGAIRGGAIRMAMAMIMGRDGVPITPATATATPRPRWRPLLLGPSQSLDAARQTRPLPRAAVRQRLPIGRLSAGRQLRILSFLRLGKAAEQRSH